MFMIYSVCKLHVRGTNYMSIHVGCEDWQSKTLSRCVHVSVIVYICMYISKYIYRCMYIKMCTNLKYLKKSKGCDMKLSHSLYYTPFLTSGIGALSPGILRLG